MTLRFASPWLLLLLILMGMPIAFSLMIAAAIAMQKAAITILIGALGLAACAPSVPNSAGQGVGFTTPEALAAERARREAALRGATGPDALDGFHGQVFAIDLDAFHHAPHLSDKLVTHHQQI